MYCSWRARPTSGTRPKQTVGNLTPLKEFVVKLNEAITPSSAGIIVALADGLFGRGGLSVSLLSGSGDADAIASDNLTETNAVTRMEP